MPRLMIVEDDAHLADGLKFNFEQEGYDASVVGSAEEALESFSEYDMIVLDLMLPGISGIDLLKKIRERDHKFPVLILSARVMEEDRLEGLAAGADDYMAKPFSLPELILRVKRIIQRREWYRKATVEEPVYSFGDFSINFETFEAKTVQGEVSLTLHESLLMKYLIANKNRIVPRDELLEKVWGYNVAVETRTVDMFIARLRKLFEHENSPPQYIKSARGVGYGFFE